MAKRFNESNNSKKVVYANACYTGGNVYLFIGKFSDGTYFMTSSEWEPWIYNVRKEPFFDYDDSFDYYGEDCWIDSWMDAEDNFISESKDEKTYNDMLKYIIKNKPNGNYSISDLEWYLENPDDTDW